MLYSHGFLVLLGTLPDFCFECPAEMRHVIKTRFSTYAFHRFSLHKQFFCFHYAAIGNILTWRNTSNSLKAFPQRVFVDKEMVCKLVKPKVIAIVLMNVLNNFVYAVMRTSTGIVCNMMVLVIEGIYIQQKFRQ